ncbi:HSP90-domain-containing protein [Auriscalpium vulgare]|uniref:HSP90-domain-containing protein n=1 Tax=Auriscalpium vulgare TaxID=40419 RepID=A0ACB8SCK2_9AGAM|nr:HSP90-domain-containing protein [Auriscalpium vulgare]
MAAPAFPAPVIPPPLPPGWTEHLGTINPSPAGQSYYYNAQTNESTYVRPLPTFPVLAQVQAQAAAAAAPKKKEKPAVKTPIPGTDWLRVKTTQGNVFYTQKAKKESVWAVPEEIREAVAALEAQEEEVRVRTAREASEQAKKAAEEEEIERIRREVEAQVAKRKAEEDVPLDEVVVTKRAKVEEDEDEDDEDGEESEEEEWQKEAAAQLAAEAEEEKQRQLEDEQRKKEEAAEEQTRLKEQMKKLNMPDRVDLSIEEGKALFKTLLREKDVNPLHPWDTSLPLFISDPRYVLLPSVSARREAFDEYCRERARELRASRVKKEKEDPKEEFERLLTEEVKSTRTSWTDFRRTWKKDRRFYGWGRDDREREKRFRDYIKELGEKKRAAAQKAEADFFSLLRESGKALPGTMWKDVKRDLTSDHRYDAIGSSSLREELFRTFLKAQESRAAGDDSRSIASDHDHGAVDNDADKAKKRKDRKEQAVKEREEKVKAERDRLEADINQSRMGLNKEEAELEFRTLLVDAIREPQTTWDGSLPQLQTDPRFTRSILPLNHQLHLFHEHIGQLRARHVSNLHSLFASSAPSLATPFSALPVESLLSALPVTKLGYNIVRLEDDFDKWQRERTMEARAAFDEMLRENAFIDFWGRLGKIGGEGADGGVKRDDDFEEDEGEAGGGNVDMKALAKHVDISDMEKVLKSDKRYLMFDHAPEQRERWIRDYLSAISYKARRAGATWQKPSESFHSPTGAAMRILNPLLALSLTLVSYVSAQDLGAEAPADKHGYQSDVARLRNIVINSLYSHREVFLRELISNANDALEKLRLTALTNKDVWDGASPLNITIRSVKDAEGPGGRLVITDTGIGMTPEELTANLGTLAKSGTTEFLARAEGSQDTTGTGNLIGAFGLGFYSSFLVADRVYVASVAAKTAANPDPQQYVFSSSADSNDFVTYQDPRGRTLERGTEITLVLKPEATEYLSTQTLRGLVSKHSGFSSSFPIYLFEQHEDEVVVEDEEDTPVATPEAAADIEKDEDEAVIEEVNIEDEEPVKAKKTKKIVVDEWNQLNAQPPLWTRDPKNVSNVEYSLFYQATWKDFSGQPLAWTHFSGDLGTSISFRAIVYVPPKLSEEYWQAPLESTARDIRLMVKRVFITSDLGENYLPKWISWNTSFLRQVKNVIVKRVIQMFTKIAEEDKDTFQKIQESYGNTFKLGAVEDTKNRDKLAALVRLSTNQRNFTSLDDYFENKKVGQKQIFYVSDMGKTVQQLTKSVFVEKLHARGYEVFLLTEPLDEILFQNLRQWKGIPFQDAAKAGLKFGDEELDPEEEKEQRETVNDKFKPLLTWIKDQAGNVVRDVIISDRLVTSPCAIVADASGYTANVQRLMSSSNSRQAAKNPMHEFAKRQKVLELNPRSPLIEGLLRRVEGLPGPEEERDLEAEDELREVTAILIDGALVRSGFEVPDSDEFLVRVDRVLRRSLGVSETAPTDTTVKPAPPVDPEVFEETVAEPQTDVPDVPVTPGPLAEEEDDGKARVIIPDEFKDKIQIEMEEIGEDEYPEVFHDEL